MSLKHVIVGCVCLTVGSGFAALYLGTSVQENTSVAAAQHSECPELGIPLRRDGKRGLQVIDVQTGSIADIAGLLEDDRIVGINNKMIADVDSCRQAMANISGSAVRLQVKRGDVVIQNLLPLNGSTVPKVLQVTAAAPRQCATFCPHINDGGWEECGCTVIEHKACTGCRSVSK